MPSKNPKKKPQLDKSETVEALPMACASEANAVAFFEKQRWGDSPCCPECESSDVYQMKDRKTGERNKDYRWRCRHCSRLYTVRTGMIFEESLIPLHKWARACWESASAKNGVSALEMSRKIQVSYKSALFMMHRIRFAMAPTDNDPKLDGTIEADLTFVGGKARYPVKKKGPNPLRPKQPVFAVVQRGGEVRTRVIPNVFTHNVRDALLANADTSAHLVTDDRGFRKIGPPFASHRAVKHSRKEYVNKADPSIHTNTIEGFFSRIKRGINGVYHNVSREHLHRYCDQYAFLYNTREMTDGARTLALIDRAKGKRLMYKESA